MTTCKAWPASNTDGNHYQLCQIKENKTLVINEKVCHDKGDHFLCYKIAIDKVGPSYLSFDSRYASRVTDTDTELKLHLDPQELFRFKLISQVKEKARGLLTQPHLQPEQKLELQIISADLASAEKTVQEIEKQNDGTYNPNPRFRLLEMGSPKNAIQALNHAASVNPDLSLKNQAIQLGIYLAALGERYDDLLLENQTLKIPSLDGSQKTVETKILTNWLKKGSDQVDYCLAIADYLFSIDENERAYRFLDKACEIAEHHHKTFARSYALALSESKSNNPDATILDHLNFFLDNITLEDFRENPFGDRLVGQLIDITANNKNDPKKTPLDRLDEARELYDKFIDLLPENQRSQSRQAMVAAYLDVDAQITKATVAAIRPKLQADFLFTQAFEADGAYHQADLETVAELIKYNSVDYLYAYPPQSSLRFLRYIREDIAFFVSTSDRYYLYGEVIDYFVKVHEKPDLATNLIQAIEKSEPSLSKSQISRLRLRVAVHQKNDEASSHKSSELISEAFDQENNTDQKIAALKEMLSILST